MPALAAIIRVVIMALVSAAPLTAAQEVVDGTLKKLVGYMRDEEGLTLQEAKDVVGNILADLALNAAILGTIMKTKIAIKTAEYFGFTAKGVTKKVLTGKAAKVAAKYAGPLEKFKAMSLVNKLIVGGGIFGSLTWIGVGIANVVEPGIYKPREANDVWQRFTGIRPFPEKGISLSPGNMDATRFNDLARSLEVAGIRGFNDPVNRQSRLYSREGLADIIDYAYGKALLEGAKVADYRDILPLIRPYLIGGTTTPSPSSTSAITPPPTPPATAVKVFTGIVSQGVVGSGLSFTPRQDDLIESAEELQQAINNNVASYLVALPSRVTYEIKVVSSVIVNGLRKVGTSQRVVSGYYTNGQPKYKNITNKFAVATLYLITGENSRSKLTSIVLGPTDALKFQPTSDDLINVAAAVPQNVVTSNTDEISTVVTNTPTTVVPPATPDTLISQPSKGYCFIYDGYKGQMCFNTATIDRLRGEVARGDKTVEAAMLEVETRHLRDFGGNGADAWANDNPNVVLNLRDNDFAKKTLRDMLTTGVNVQSEFVEKTAGADESPPGRGTPITATPVATPSAPAPSLPLAALSATTLFTYYAALGQQLPSLAERGQIYQSFGLGQSAFYMGTAEQNTRLLNALQGK